MALLSMLVAPLPLALTAAAAIMFVFVGIVWLRRPDTVHERLDSFGAQPRNLEELELQQPFSARVLRPMVRGVASLILSRTPQSTVDRIRRDLIVAGSPSDLDVRDFLGLKGLAAVLPAGTYAVLFSRGQPMMQALLIGLGLALVGYYLPNMWLNQQIQTRKKEITKSLPDALDLLTICVEAGLGFDAALHKVTEKWSNALGVEFERVLSEIRMGRSRRDALREMAARVDVPDVASFVAAIVQADQLGVSISRALHIQADQMRTKRRQRSEELAHQAAIKMIFPMVILIFPSLFIILLGPSLPSLAGGLLR